MQLGTKSTSLDNGKITTDGGGAATFGASGTLTAWINDAAGANPSGSPAPFSASNSTSMQRVTIAPTGGDTLAWGYPTLGSVGALSAGTGLTSDSVDAAVKAYSGYGLLFQSNSANSMVCFVSTNVGIGAFSDDGVHTLQVGGQTSLDSGAISTDGSGKATAAKLNLYNLPTSSSGLSSGDVWNDSGTLKIV